MWENLMGSGRGELEILMGVGEGYAGGGAGGRGEGRGREKGVGWRRRRRVMGLSKVLSSTGIDEKCLTWHEWYERLPVHLLVPVPFHYNRISQTKVNIKAKN